MIGCRLSSLIFSGFLLLKAQAAQSETVYLVSGGYVSCRTSWNKPTDAPLFRMAKTKLAPTAFVASCYGSNSTSLEFVGDHGEAPVTAGVPELTEAVRARLLEAGEGAKLVILGHSYGGWVALQVAAALGPDVSIAYLATIDPISTKLCPPSNFASSISGSASVPYPPCTMAPGDLAASFGELRSLGIPWTQFYQDRYRYLKSSAIAEATTNRYLDYPALTDFWAFEAHAVMDQDPRVWETLTHDLASITGP